jgi:hypothetical protein
VIGGPKPQLVISTVPSEGVVSQQEATDTSDAIWDTPSNNGTPGPSVRQQPAAIQIPVGDACREDGTLKDASEMEWLHSPSDERSQLEPNEKWGQSPSSELKYPDSPSEPASVRSLSKQRRHHDELDSEDERPHRAKVSEQHATVAALH